MSELKAVFDFIIIEPIKDKEERRGAIVVADMGQERPLKGKIISVGPGRYSFTGEILPTQLKVGEIVIIPKIGPIIIEHNGVQYYSCQEAIVQAVITE
jgi:chaperonin GroES